MNPDPAAGGPGAAASPARRPARRLVGAAVGVAAVAAVALALAAGSSEPATTTAGSVPGSTSPTAPAPSASSPVTEPATTASTTTTSTSTPDTTEAPPATLTDPWWAYKGNLDGPRVLVVGDSITDQATEEIAEVLHPDFATQVIGLSGFELAEAEPYLTPYPPTRPDVVLIELGTNDGNDVLADTSGERRARWKDTMVAYRDLFPGSCFVPVTMPASRDFPAWDDSQQELNDWLLATFPDAVDWNGFELGARAAGTRLLIDDHIHPNSGGEAALAALYRRGVERCLG